MSLLLLVMCAVQVEAVQRHHQDVSENSAGANLWFTGAKVSCAVSCSHPPPLPSPPFPSPPLSSPLHCSPPSPPSQRNITYVGSLWKKKKKKEKEHFSNDVTADESWSFTVFCSFSLSLADWCWYRAWDRRTTATGHTWLRTRWGWSSCRWMETLTTPWPSSPILVG